MELVEKNWKVDWIKRLINKQSPNLLQNWWKKTEKCCLIKNLQTFVRLVKENQKLIHKKHLKLCGLIEENWKIDKQKTSKLLSDW